MKELVVCFNQDALAGPGFSSVPEGLNIFCARRDFVGLGNLILEILMRPCQEIEPDEYSQWVAQNVRRMIEEAYRLTKDWSYGMPHRDRHLPSHHRSKWREDVFPQVVIFAYVLGATWRTLPPPHDRLAGYYFLMADEQKKELLKAKQTISRIPRPKPLKPPRPSVTKESLTAKIEQLAAAGLPSDLLVEKIADFVKPGPDAQEPVEHRTINPEDV